MFVVKEIDTGMHTKELRLCSSLIDAIYTMANNQNRMLQRISENGNVTATEDNEHLACGVITDSGLTTFAVFYRKGDETTDKPIPRLDDVAKKLAK